MNITPALPRLHDLPVQQERAVVTPVRATRPAPDAAEDASRRQTPTAPLLDPEERERLAARHELVAKQQPNYSLRANRALASYAQVAEVGERSALHDLLGFDGYA